ncbi:hypothetical protein [Paracidovorax valerianellae]|uniref:hypothetical protein n=1 Tax=Paracidovorax valerianellae TaxID=187868 RepID=UPI001114543B|nr:hypothetical protein [Paracidovorax valerianellae]MDA8443914.1 hypothetical protein [Paracidovorax valerianellae]
MPNILRSDITEIKKLESRYNLDSINFEDIQWIFHDFTKEVLLKNLFPKIKIAEDVISKIKEYNNAIENFLMGKISSDEINNIGIKSMHEAERLENTEKIVMNFASKGLCDKKRAFFDEHGGSMHFQSLFFTLQKIEKNNLCIEFRKYVENHPRMKQYRKKNP